MGFNVGGLSVWADEISSGLAKEVLLNADTLSQNLTTKKYGCIGDSTKLNRVGTTAYAVLAACGTIANTGSTTLSQTIMTHCGIEFPQFLCNEILKSYWTDWEAQKSFNTESLGRYEDVMLANILETDRIALDKMIWQADNSAVPYKTGLTGNLTLCRGFLGTAYAYSATTAANLAKTAMTIVNAGVVIQSVLASVPEVIADKAVAYLSPLDFQKVVAWAVNEYKYNASLIDINAITEFRFPTSLGLVIKKVNGMSGVDSGTMIVTTTENIVLGISDESDLGLFSWYEKKDRGLWVNLKVKIGTGYYFPEITVLVK